MNRNEIPPLPPYHFVRNGRKGGFFVKKAALAVIIGLFGFLASSLPALRAEDYSSYQDLLFEESGQRLLEDFTAADYEEYYGLLTGKHFMGWRLVLVTEDQRVQFVAETKLKVYNRGYSTIKHEITLKTVEETSLQISASGDLGVTVKGDVKKFSGGADASIKAAVKYEATTTHSEEYVFKISIDPGTYVSIITRGEARVNNGVAQYHFFWIRLKKGGWETFTVTTEYFEIVKERLG